jgi:glycolate oxidase iron-sulfur subunit
MQTNLADFIRDTSDGKEADAILRKCVHCGFCTATCPTYQLLGDELDGPRGRIYLIKQVLEGKPATEATQLHLDRCLTCRNCETTCPSGVQYGKLLDIGRHEVERQVGRSGRDRLTRAALREGLTSDAFAPAMKVGQLVRSFLPGPLKNKVPPRQDAGAWPRRHHKRKVLMLAGCVQPSMLPNVNSATARVLDTLGIESIVPAAVGCCGAIRQHLNDHDGAAANMRANIDAWWPHVEAGVEAIVMNASGCGAMVKEYGFLLRDNPQYAEKARVIVGKTVDLAELLPSVAGTIKGKLKHSARAERVAFHPPCTLQHGQKVRGAVEGLLCEFGAEVVAFNESHLCCGSAGTYSVLQPELSYRLRDRKLQNVQAARPEVILSANVGCITHLQSGTGTRVEHWIEWLDRRLK